ncbi:ATP-binding protein [Streptomyces sp. NPDC088789]|uniref:ATP-binding protein n=1 Tax=Streptomyces sp. NPDC088789 TaxID=3365899 RepID=UPI00381FEAB6
MLAGAAVPAGAWAAGVSGALAWPWTAAGAAAVCAGLVVVCARRDRSRASARRAALGAQRETGMAHTALEVRAGQLEGALANARAWVERYSATLERGRAEVQARAGVPVPAASVRGRGGPVPHDPFAEFDRLLTASLGDVVAAVEKARTDGDWREARIVGSVAPRLHGTITHVLTVLDDVETSIEDPTVLGILFRAELQASLARRYCESLMVLGGGGHFAPSRDPVPLGKVVRVGIAETRHHRRVDTRFPLDQDLWLVGYAGPAVIHMLSALVDNALGYSPPDETVSVRVERHSRGLRIEVEDHGLSMSEQALAEANALLAGPAAHLVQPRLAEGRIGLPVVAQLAAVYGITVGLRAKQAPEQGIVATLALPGDLLVTLEQLPPAARPEHPLPAPAPAAGPSAPAAVTGRAGTADGSPPPVPGASAASVQVSGTALAPGPHPAAAGDCPQDRPLLPRRVRSTASAPPGDSTTTGPAGPAPPREADPPSPDVIGAFFSASRQVRQAVPEFGSEPGPTPALSSTSDAPHTPHRSNP